MDHDTIIDTLSRHMNDVPGVRALFLGGSFGTGMADAYSDIDFVMVAEDAGADQVIEAWRDAISRTGEIVLWWKRSAANTLINAITAQWARIDVIILRPDKLDAHTKDRLNVLFDHDGLYDGLRETAPETPQDPKRFLYQVEEFIRILGLLHLAAGREEYINGVLGIFHLRNALVDLLIEETNAPHRGGILHLNRLITDEQKAVLTALPAPIANREAMIEGHLAYAKAYLPRARKRARALGVDWPERFEEVTWQMLSRTLAIEPPYDRDQHR